MEVAQSPICVYALGGLCEVGKNTYCIESDDSIIIIDAGVMFPDPELVGVNYVIPDYQKLRSARQKVKALFITHGHEDHIGGIPFLVQNLTIPVIYAPKLAAALIKHKLEDARIKEPVNIIEYDSDSIINVGEFKVSFFYVTHSIPDSYGIVVDTPQGRIVHTGDFKIDLTPVGREMEINKISRLGDEGVDLLLSDSTNAEIEGYTPSERNVLSSIQEIFENAPSRVILATFSSNINRIQQIVQVAVEKGRKIAILGRSMENVVQTARDFGYIKIPDVSLIPINEINLHKNSEICVICTGSQGEPMAALSRIAQGDHPDLRIIPGDTIIFSSSAIPGNGQMIENLVNQLVRRGADVIVNSGSMAVHSSGHPSNQELRLMLRLVRPKYFMPIHGEYRMLKIHGEIAQSVGVPKENIFVLENGDSITLNKHKIVPGPSFPAEPVYIDGKNINGQKQSVIEDRAILQRDGLIAVIFGIDSKKGAITVPPSVITRAFISDDIHFSTRIQEITSACLEELIKNKTTFADIKAAIKRDVSTYILRKTGRKPMVIPVVMDKI